MNGSMDRREARAVMGVKAGPVRLTPLGAAILALAVALPGGAVLALGEWVLRGLTGG
jgi:hypothetical protein